MKRVSNRVMNLAHFLRQAARRHPEDLALVWGDSAWTWSQLDARVDALAAELSVCGIAKSDAVLVQSRNNNQIVESMFACFRIGAIWVPTNFRQTPDEVAYLAESSGARLLLCDAAFPEHAARCALPQTILIGDKGYDGYEARIAVRLGMPFTDADVDYDDACWFFYTSGTTGRPKAAVLTHGQMAFVVTNHLCDLMPGTTARDSSLVVAPLSHGAGIHLLTQVARAAKTILPASGRFDPSEAFALIERWRVSNMFTVPTILNLLVEHEAATRFDLSSLRYVIYAGAPMYRVDQKRALATLGKVIVQYYGLGEVTGAITVLRPEDHQTDDGPGTKIGTCGRERTGMQVSIQDDNGTYLMAGETGEICVCGPSVFAGYYGNDEANATSFRNGWFRTGDIGHLDEQGDLFITGRASDMYISGGSNVYPREIEEKLLTHDAIAEVAIVGVPDEKWGEAGVAACVLRKGASLTEEELLEWMRGRVAAYKLPRRIFFLDELPKSGYGKVTKSAIRQLVLDREVERKRVDLFQ